MKALLGTVATIVFALGIATGLLGLVMIGYGILAPAQPPPSLNEGRAYAYVFGIFVTFVGIVGVVIGKAIGAGLNQPASRTVAGEPVVAAERPGGPSDRT